MHIYNAFVSSLQSIATVHSVSQVQFTGTGETKKNKYMVLS